MSRFMHFPTDIQVNVPRSDRRIAKSTLLELPWVGWKILIQNLSLKSIIYKSSHGLRKFEKKNEIFFYEVRSLKALKF